MTKCPYTFPARSRKAMTEYILDRVAYVDHFTSFPFSWNVKVNHVDYENPKGEVLDSSLDEQWTEYVRNNDYVFIAAIEDAQRDYTDGLYSTWPGDDQGDYIFGFYGRQGGHICLETYRGVKIYGRGFDMVCYVAELSLPELRKLYRALVCMDSDFTPRKASENVEHHVNFQRTLWEERQHEQLVEAARDMESERPDLYA